MIVDSTLWGLLAEKANHLIGTMKEGRKEGDMGGGGKNEMMSAEAKKNGG